MNESAIAQPTPIYLDDLTVGTAFVTAEHIVRAEEIVAFARQFDPQPFHVDARAAAESGFGGLVASGWHTASLTMRLLVDCILGRSMTLGSPGVDNLRWLLPVRPGDTLSARITVADVRPSQSKPDRGIVRTLIETTNQRGETVLRMEALVLYLRRDEYQVVSGE